MRIEWTMNELLKTKMNKQISLPNVVVCLYSELWGINSTQLNIKNGRALGRVGRVG
jgi:hypothetical protein